MDSFIEGVYDGIKKEKRWVKFGISPFGVYRSGQPAGITAGVDQYAELYADARKWLREGWCDYWSPQLYWPIAQRPQSFPVLLDYWLGENRQGRHVWPGQFTSRVDPAEGKWLPKEITDQIAIERQKGADGTIHFSMKALMKNVRGLRTILATETYRTRAAVPESPWLGDAVPPAPRALAFVRADGANARLTVETTPEVRFVAVATATRLGDERVWSDYTLSSGPSVPVRFGPQEEAIALASVSRTGVWSAPALYEPQTSRR